MLQQKKREILKAGADRRVEAANLPNLILKPNLISSWRPTQM